MTANAASVATLILSVSSDIVTEKLPSTHDGVPSEQKMPLTICCLSRSSCTRIELSPCPITVASRSSAYKSGSVSRTLGELKSSLACPSLGNVASKVRGASTGGWGGSWREHSRHGRAAGSCVCKIYVVIDESQDA